MARWNPFSFTPGPVVILTSALYIALFASLLVTHLQVPDYPSKTPLGINLTEAWSDLEHITRRFHPYNSHENDNVRAYLRDRIDSIIKAKQLDKDQVTVFDDNISNVTFSEGTESVYFEGTNIIIAIRGSDDDEPYYSSKSSLNVRRRANNPGVLVNAHYDSVSSGYGATDDGVGIVTILQLLSYFTEKTHWPKRTIILLLNNGEEDFLNGAKAFMRHPISQVPHTFVNLEGAGAGGRATLFRTTDAEVTRYYKSSSHPFGTVVSSDGFKKHLIRSETDYKVFYEELGLRGLDIAFMEPRARYHTIEDSTRETSLSSVWHMLSAAVATTSGLASDTSTRFSSDEDDYREDGKVPSGSGTDGVWFDLYGKVFLVFEMHTMFALCVTLLVVAPLLMIGLTVGLSKADKNYLFARRAYVHSENDDQPVHLYGWRGFCRFPVIVVSASAVVVGLAYLVVRVNPFIAYSSPFAVWGMMFSAWISVAWFLSRATDAVRPSALHRMYALIWLFVGAFVLLAIVTVLANNYQVAGGYFSLSYFAGVSIALVLSYLELFFAPSKATFAALYDQAESTRRNSQVASRPLTGSSTAATRSDDRHSADDDATETTSLLRGDRRSFARYGAGRDAASDTTPAHEEASWRLELKQPYPGEQEWSGELPSWIWILQLLLVAPTIIILVGQLGLLLTSALPQTPADGSSSLFIYIGFAAVTILLLAPVGPFLHRFTYHVPTFVFLVCVATVIYNLIAFPFSRDHRLKVYFGQQVDCTTGMNTVSLTGVDGYVQSLVSEIPSAQGQHINCSIPSAAKRKELRTCSWEGLPPKVVPSTSLSNGELSDLSKKAYASNWLDYSIKRGNQTNNFLFRVAGQNTRACRIVFDSPVSGLAVGGAVSDPRFNAVGGKGSREIRLWHREWTSQPWNVSVTWNTKNNSTHSGKVVCLWSDANSGDIPAFDEVQHYLPVWAIPTKLGDGLVEGFKRFEI